MRKAKWGYYILTVREPTDPPSWRWRIVRRGAPMGVRIEEQGFGSYHAARLAGRNALDEFLVLLFEEKMRID